MKFKALNIRNISIRPCSALPFVLIIFIIVFTLFEGNKYSEWSTKRQNPGEFISISQSICFLTYINKNDNFSANYFVKKRAEQRFFIPPCIFSLIKQSRFRYNNIIFIGLNYFLDIPFCLYSRSPPKAQS